ncbi:MAG: antitoxin component YwqK of YwqJK toxin-antitoxin module [Ulvibacter sp.]|jgi:antitoxin component YwqK of YwqJK toxin-antitoxin module
MRIFLIVACLLFLANCADRVVESSLVERLGVTYKINSQLPFTGVVPNYHNNGQLKYTKPYIDGKLQGLVQTYFQIKDDTPEGAIERGPLKSLVNFVAGKKDGFAQYYRENGQLESKKHYSDGKQDGFHHRFRKNGQLESKKHYSDGKKSGLQETYYKNGQLSARWNLKEEVKYGPSKKYYKNGQLKYGGQYIGGKRFSKKQYSETGRLIPNGPLP